MLKPIEISLKKFIGRTYASCNSYTWHEFIFVTDNKFYNNFQFYNTVYRLRTIENENKGHIISLR